MAVEARGGGGGWMSGVVWWKWKEGNGSVVGSKEDGRIGWTGMEQVADDRPGARDVTPREAVCASKRALGPAGGERGDRPERSERWSPDPAMIVRAAF